MEAGNSRDSRFDLSGSNPTWLRRLNGVGRALTSAGDAGAMGVPLDMDSLLAEAQNNTGLTDFGPDDIWREGLEILTDSLQQEARLTLVGRLLCRGDIVNALEARLRIEDCYRRTPAIDEERVETPLFIVGLPRTGTSILHEILAQDPAHRVPLSWEARYPCPPPEEQSYETDPRIAHCEDYVQFWNELVPEYRAMHEMGAKVPCECIWLTMPTFAVEEWLGRAQIPAFGLWYAGVEQRPVYAYHRKVLKLLQHRFRRTRWVLKAPSHMAVLATLFAEYPDARVIMTHRDPLKSMGSTASILAALAWMRSENADVDIIKASFGGEGMAQRIEMALAAREQISAAQFFDVHYQELIADPLRLIRRLYTHFGMELTAQAEQRMREYMANKPKGKHGTHNYSFADLGLDLNEERARFAEYQQRFNIPSEVKEEGEVK